jgi:hypothetical protein
MGDNGQTTGFNTDPAANAPDAAAVEKGKGKAVDYTPAEDHMEEDEDETSEDEDLVCSLSTRECANYWSIVLTYSCPSRVVKVIYFSSVLMERSCPVV